MDYVHRSGRTGRAGHTGTVVSLVTPEQHKDVRGVQNALGLEPGLLAPFSAADAGPIVRRGGGSPEGPEAHRNGEVLQQRPGYGFVEHRGGEDLFVHHSQVQGDARQGIAPGSTVEFTIGAGRRGDEAQNVKVL